MKKIFVMVVAAMMAALGIHAQTNMAGRVYHNPNVMAAMIEQETDLDAKLAESRKNAIAKQEKEKGRKLTEAEIAEVDKVMAEARKKAQVAKKCMSTAITIEFTTATDLVMKQKTKVDDQALKTIGVGWFKRKALKAALAIMPESQKGTYEVVGNKIYVIDGKDRDTLIIANDGKTISGKLNNKTKFTLKRTK